MHNKRSIVIRNVSKIILEKHLGNLEGLLNLCVSSARAVLMDLPGIGYKTADVVLLFYGGKYVIPVDRHIDRIAKRLNLVEQKAKYEEVRKTLEKTVNDELFLSVHLSLIQFGRETCRARAPRCNTCFLNDQCSFPLEFELMD